MTDEWRYLDISDLLADDDPAQALGALSRTFLESIRSELDPTLWPRANHLARQIAAGSPREIDGIRQGLANEMKAAEAAEEAVRQPALARLREELERDFLGSRAWYESDPSRSVLGDEGWADVAVEHVMNWCRDRFGPGSPIRFEPSPEQARAIATVDRHALVAARAGSGKTTTLVVRAVFLIEVCDVDPTSIMMLAFNTDAAQEIRNRLEAILVGPAPHVLTFHALAYRLVRPDENLVADQSDTMRPLSRLVQTLIDEMRRDPRSYFMIRRTMLEYFEEDWARIKEKPLASSPTEQLEHRLMQEQSLKGDPVKSSGEKKIANILLRNGVCGQNSKRGRWSRAPYYAYEKNFYWNGYNYRPDFTVLSAEGTPRVVIEYFGLKGDADYDEDSDRKRSFWSDRPEIFLEYGPADVHADGFEERLLTDLRDAGANLTRLTDDEVWDLIKDRALDQFTEAVTQVIGRARQRQWSGQDLVAELERLGVRSRSVRRFVKICGKLLDRYADRLVKENREDFTGLMWRAVADVATGTSVFGSKGRAEGDLRGIKHVVVDEFQDFSVMFAALLAEVQRIATESTLMAVGDDWQAINGFAGSTTSYFETFVADHPRGDRLALSTNRRSASELVALGNSVMAGFGEPARSYQRMSASIRWLEAEKFAPSAMEERFFQFDQGQRDARTPLLVRLISQHRQDGRSVAVLSRKRKGNWTIGIRGKTYRSKDLEGYGRKIRDLLAVEDPEELRFSTTHGFKGQEADAVIMIGVSGRTYPLIHPLRELFDVFGDTDRGLIDAERRLFYVGVSRARTHLDVVTGGPGHSFWQDVIKEQSLKATSWDRIPEVRLGPTGVDVEVQVYNSIRDSSEFERSKAILKSVGFKYRPQPTPHWVKVVKAEGFDLGVVGIDELLRIDGVKIDIWRDGVCVDTMIGFGGTGYINPF